MRKIFFPQGRVFGAPGLRNGSNLDKIKAGGSLKTMKWALLAAKIALVSSLQAQDTGGTGLLDKVISHPGSYSQVCDVMSAPADLPYRAFQISGFSGASFSKANLAKIKENRETVVKEIRARLLELDLKTEAKTPSEDPTPEENNDGDAYGCDPKTLNPLLLELIQEVHAVEALPELLAVESKLVKGIAEAKDDAKAAPPLVSGWYVANEGGSEYDEKESDAKRDRRVNLFQARVAQRDVVMTIALLLREKTYEPYLKTRIETAYAKGIRALVKTDGLDKFKPGEPVPPELEGMEIKIDPITKVPVATYSSVAIPYSRESRDEIRAVAGKWISEHP